MTRKLPTGVRAHVRDGGRTSYEAKVSDAAGRRHSRSFDTVEQAVEWRSEYLRDVRHGTALDLRAGRTTLADYSVEWMAKRVRRNKKGTVEGELSNWRLHVMPYLGPTPLQELSGRQIQRWVDSLSPGLAPATIDKVVTLLSACLKAAVIDRIIGFNPAEGVQRPSIEDTEARFMTTEELRAILRVIDEWWQIVVYFMADAGLRIGEVAALLVQDMEVDLSTGRSVQADRLTREQLPLIVGGSVQVRETVREVSKKVSGADTYRTTGSPKTRAGGRLVPTISRTVARRVAEQALDRNLQAGDPLFVGKHGAPIGPHNWRARVWNKAVEQSGVAEPLPTPHSLRHTAVSRWIDSGQVNEFVLAKWAGHRSTVTLQRIYGHLLPQNAESLRARLDEDWTDEGDE